MVEILLEKKAVGSDGVMVVIVPKQSAIDGREKDVIFSFIIGIANCLRST